MRRIRLFLSLSLVIVSAAVLTVYAPSCASGPTPAQRDALIANLDQTKAALQTQLDAANAELARLKASGGDPKAIAANEKAISLYQTIISRITQGQTVLQASVGTDGSIQIGPAIAAAGGLLGQPWQTYATLGAGLLTTIFGLFRANQNANAVASIAKGIDKVSIADPELSKKLDAAWPEIEKLMTPTAIKLVNANSVT